MGKKDQPGWRAAHNRRIAEAARNSAIKRQCPGCLRFGALKRVESTDGVIVGRKCRYCGIERVIDLSAVLWK